MEGLLETEELPVEFVVHLVQNALELRNERFSTHLIQIQKEERNARERGRTVKPAK